MRSTHYAQHLCTWVTSNGSQDAGCLSLGEKKMQLTASSRARETVNYRHLWSHRRVATLTRGSVFPPKSSLFFSFFFLQKTCVRPRPLKALTHTLRHTSAHARSGGSLSDSPERVSVALNALRQGTWLTTAPAGARRLQQAHSVRRSQHQTSFSRGGGGRRVRKHQLPLRHPTAVGVD